MKEGACLKLIDLRRVVAPIIGEKKFELYDHNYTHSKCATMEELRSINNFAMTEESFELVLKEVKPYTRLNQE